MQVHFLVPHSTDLIISIVSSVVAKSGMSALEVISVFSRRDSGNVRLPVAPPAADETGPITVTIVPF